MSTYQRRLTNSRVYTSNGTGGCFSGSSNEASQLVTVGGTRTLGSNLPSWKKRIRKGQSATTTLSGSWLELTYSPGSSRARKLCNPIGPDNERWATETVSGYFGIALTGGTTGAPSSPSSSMDPTVANLALSRFVQNARSAQGSFRGSTFVAELADTLRGIRNPAKGIRGLLDHYATRSRNNVRKAIGKDPRSVRVSELKDSQARAGSRALSDSWLEAQFGILPLVSDMKSAYQAYKGFADREPRVPIRATATSDPVQTKVLGNSPVTNMLWLDLYIYTETELSCRFIGAVKCRVETFRSDAIEEAGFRFRDFAPALWEWIPYSFLVDYFTNIGDLIECASFPRSEIAWAQRTWRNTVYRKVRSTVEPLSSNPFPLSNYTEIQSFIPPQIIWRRTNFARANYDGSFVPTLRFEIPGVKGFKKYLNISALALLRGMRR